MRSPNIIGVGKDITYSGMPRNWRYKCSYNFYVVDSSNYCLHDIVVTSLVWVQIFCVWGMCNFDCPKLLNARMGDDVYSWLELRSNKAHTEEKKECSSLEKKYGPLCKNFMFPKFCLVYTLTTTKGDAGSVETCSRHLVSFPWICERLLNLEKASMFPD